MNSSYRKVAIGLLVLCPSVAWAHALSPTYYPLAHLPLFLGAEWWPFFLLIPISVAVEAFVLSAWVPSVGLMGNLWRGACLYVAAKASETAAVFLLESLPLFRHAGWSSSSAENLGPLAIFLGGGLVVAVPLGVLLYGRQQFRRLFIVIAVCSASLAGYFSAAGCSVILLRARYVTVPLEITEYVAALLLPVLLIAVLLAWLARRRLGRKPIRDAGD